MSFLAICKKSESQLLAWLPSQLGSKAYLKKGKFVFKPGTVPVLLVAHCDTVHKRPPRNADVFRNPRGLVCAPGVGIGGDDRCGVFAVLELLKRLDCMAVFTTGEETGGSGARAFVEFAAEKGVKPNFAVELDRAHARDAVFYDCATKEFIEMVLKDKFYKKESGSFTDISIICPQLGCAGVNLSVGYYHAHQDGEYVSLPELRAAIDHAERLIRRGRKTRYKYEAVKREPYRYSRWDYDDWKTYRNWSNATAATAKADPKPLKDVLAAQPCPIGEVGTVGTTTTPGGIIVPKRGEIQEALFPDARPRPRQGYESGYCDNCGEWFDNLRWKFDCRLCPECANELDVCDECQQQSDELREFRDQWLCPDCLAEAAKQCYAELEEQYAGLCDERSKLRLARAAYEKEMEKQAARKEVVDAH